MSEVKIPEGFKQTEVGIIPEDWEVKELGSQSLKIGSGSDYKDKNGTYPLYGSTGIIGKSKFFSYDQQSILVARVGANAGLVNLVNGKYGVSDNTIVINLNNNNDVEFIKSWLIKKDLNTLVFGSGQPLITGTQLKKLLIALPSKSKQTAIATALSDVDNLIGSLEKLIAKKEAIKTGTMQQLLTGKTRLPEFATHDDGSAKGFEQTELGQIPEDWEVINLGDIGNCVIGLTYSPNDVSKFGTLVLRSSNVQNGQLAYKDNVYVDMSLPERVIVKEGDILICVRNGSRRLIGKCALIDKNSEGHAFGAFMSVFRTKLYPFIFYQFQSNLIQNQIQENMGATINQITNKDLKSFTVMLPENIREQTAIATVLSDIDTEIQSLQQRLEKTKDIKQGMMQQLLTGKVRLAH